MSVLFSSADFLWKLLIIVTLASTSVIVAYMFAQFFLRRTSGVLTNKIARFSIGSILLTVVVGALLLLGADRDLQESCFGSFAASQGTFSVTRWLGGIWFTGFLAMVMRDGFQYLLLLRGIEKAILEKRQEYLVVSDNIPPSSLGVFSTRILIPRSLTEKSEQLAHIIAHEKTHANNDDGFWSAMALLVRRLCWFNPLLYFFERSRVLAMEMTTDEQTLQQYRFNPTAYANSLVESLVFAQKSNVWVRGAALDFAQMKRRLRNLQREPSRKSLKCYPLFIFVIMAVGWAGGVQQAFASLKLKQSPEEMMCYQVQHEKFIDGWLHLRAEPNKCE